MNSENLNELDLLLREIKCGFLGIGDSVVYLSLGWCFLDDEYQELKRLYVLSISEASVNGVLYLWDGSMVEIKGSRAKASPAPPKECLIPYMRLVKGPCLPSAFYCFYGFRLAGATHVSQIMDTLEDQKKSLPVYWELNPHVEGKPIYSVTDQTDRTLYLLKRGCGVVVGIDKSGQPHAIAQARMEKVMDPAIGEIVSSSYLNTFRMKAYYEIWK